MGALLPSSVLMRTQPTRNPGQHTRTMLSSMVQKWDYNRLRCIDLETCSALTLFSRTAHVNGFAWNAESDQLVYVLQRTPGYMDPALIHGVSFGRLPWNVRQRYLFALSLVLSVI